MPGGGALARDLARTLVSTRTGVVQAVRPFSVPFGRRPLFGHAGQLAHRLPRPDAGVIQVGGVSWDRDQAMVAALAEGLERHIWSQPAGAPAMLTADRIAREGVPAHRFVRPAPSELRGPEPDPCCGSPDRPCPPPSAFTDHPWLPGRCLRTGRRRWALAGTISPGYRHPPMHGYMCDLTTTGVAAGPTRAAALLGGAAEVIERDAYVISHVNRLALPEIDLSTVRDPRIDTELNVMAGSRRIAVRAWDMTLDVEVPTILCGCLVDVDGIPTLRLGAATHPSARTALRKAWTEAALGAWAVRPPDVRARRRSTLAVGDTTLGTPEDHAGLCDRLDYAEGLGWLLHPRRQLLPFAVLEERDAPGDDPCEHLEWTVAQLARCGLDAFGFELTPPDIAEATRLQVWRVVVPGAQPLVFGHGPVGLASERLRGAPVRCGARATPLPVERFNPLPHCFP